MIDIMSRHHHFVVHQCVIITLTFLWSLNYVILTDSTTSSKDVFKGDDKDVALSASYNYGHKQQDVEYGQKQQDVEYASVFYNTSRRIHRQVSPLSDSGYRLTLGRYI